MSVFAPFEAAAAERIAARHPDDVPTVATAMLLRCPIWTEDQDFFGCGMATWNSATIDIFLREAKAEA